MEVKLLAEWMIALGVFWETVFQHPGAKWAGIVFSSMMIVMLVTFRHHWGDFVPHHLYSMIVLLFVAGFDYLSGVWWSLWIYLITLGVLHDRDSTKKTVLSTLLFFGVYTLLQYGFSISDSFSDVLNAFLLFLAMTLMTIYLRRARARTEKIKEQNRRLLEKVDEAHSRLHEYIEELEETSRRDYLTGLYNFSGFQEQVSKSLARCSVAGQYYYVICLDLVDFQQVNMKEGINAGDQMLVQIARLLKKKLPPYAQVARYDGDQFAIGLTGDDSAMRLCLDTIETVIGGLRTERSLMNYCIGTASYPMEAQNESELIRLAEHRLSIEQRRIRHQEEERRRHLEKLSAVGQLAAGLAHEIRNPLTSIRGFIQISAMESPEVKKWESIMLPEIDRINDLLKQFLHLSESRPARYTLFNVDRLIDDVFQLLQPKAILMGHELKSYAPTSPVIIEADAEQLKQVLINLVQNGLESLQDKGMVSVRWKEVRDRISIRIQDNGSGIPPEYMSRIFDPFFTTKGDGTGMGLSICHRIISEHGGQVHVTSQPGRGTTFNIHLPIRQAGKKEREQNQPEQETPALSKLNRSEVVERVNMLKNF
ncbi:diguanylate cyclase (GGDEF)-like protein [Desmospora activa DSM 45169]|uniref:histidine kinase n=1 Tax=Desmospora activa DSM 45169 TaxID=1121389 RepID=A0A2T4Z4P3_9BACL|nr:diguanylate cyclase (GGDEF)-like protein [Desmospora activa DSM 45169]